jgi:nondiscriminating aspartyl-tRNA synthetase
MEKRVLSRELPAHTGHEVLIAGWVHQVRQLGNLAFLVVRDRLGLVQCVLEGALAGLAIENESVVQVQGKAVATDKVALGAEVWAKSVTVIAPAVRALPFELNKKNLKAGLDLQLDHRPLSLRHPKVNAVFRIQSTIAGAFREYLSRQGFTEIHTPKIVATGTEGGSNLFPIQYFEQQAYLAQSPQFYKQMMVGAGFERVFEIAPVFRAEEHNTSRHANEYTSLDVEMGFIQSEHDLMDLETALLQHIFARLQEQCEPELALHGATLPDLSGGIARISMAEAKAILERRFGKISTDADIDGEGERLLCQYVAEQGKPALVFVTGYPTAVRPMYAMPAAENPEVTHSFDLLMNGLEITSGGQRIHDPHMLVESMRRKGLNPESFASYLEVFYHGMPPHGGFAIGLERLTARILDLKNIREATAFPRDRTRLTP